MRELCIQQIAMSTRVALPMFLGCRMSELRRQLLQPGPTSAPSVSQQEQSTQQQQQYQPELQVRRNLFGPIDHDENLKFVQNELSKIAQSDRKRWNFDFESEKPQDGRFQWEPVLENVPQAYEMPRLNYLGNKLDTSTTNVSSTTPSTSTTVSQRPTSSHVNIIKPIATKVSSSSSSTKVPESCTTVAATPTIITTTNTTTSENPTTVTKTPSIDTLASSSTGSSRPSTDNTKCSEIVVRCNKSISDWTLTSNKQERRECQKTTTRTTTTSNNKTSVKNTARSSQPQLTDIFSIRKRKRTSSTKHDEDQPPALVKRSKPTMS